jgi:hypothetical protein
MSITISLYSDACQLLLVSKITGAADIVVTHFDEVFATSAGGYVPRWAPDVREMLITRTTT